MATADESTNDQAQGEQHAPEERMNCPKCGSPDVRRSHDHGVLAGLLRIVGRWPYRCRSCRSRFYRSGPASDVT